MSTCALRRHAALSRLVACALALHLLAAHASAQPAPLPPALSNAEFVRLSADLSEAGGDFQADDFVSKETGLSVVVASLEQRVPAGNAYVGVGAEQNFSYIAATRPGIAFIVDIRRQSIVQQLMFKAVFELSADRADFISLLFSKPRPDGLDPSATVDRIWTAYKLTPTDTTVFESNLTRIREHLTRTRGIPLSVADTGSLRYLYRAFYWLGPAISYASYAAASRTDFATISLTTDRAGVRRSFLATEERYQIVRDMQMRNLIVPVVGDFAGPKSIRGIGAYLTKHGTTLGSFYLSNVETYLFQPAASLKAFYESVGTFPMDSSSVFIRAAIGATTVVTMPRSATGEPFSADVIAATRVIPRAAVGQGLTALDIGLCPMVPYLAAYAAGRVQTFIDAVTCPR